MSNVSCRQETSNSEPIIFVGFSVGGHQKGQKNLNTV